MRCGDSCHLPCSLDPTIRIAVVSKKNIAARSIAKLILGLKFSRETYLTALQPCQVILTNHLKNGTLFKPKRIWFLNCKSTFLLRKNGIYFYKLFFQFINLSFSFSSLHQLRRNWEQQELELVSNLLGSVSNKIMFWMNWHIIPAHP